MNIFKNIKTNIDTYYWNIWWAIRNIITYYPIIIKMRTWDAEHSLELLAFSLNDLRKSLIKYNITTSCDKNALDIARAIELIDNLIKDEYYEKCGYDFSARLLKDKDKDTYSFDINEERDLNNSRAIKEATILRAKEKKELFKILNKFDTWWS